MVRSVMLRSLRGRCAVREAGDEKVNRRGCLRKTCRLFLMMASILEAYLSSIHSKASPETSMPIHDDELSEDIWLHSG